MYMYACRVTGHARVHLRTRTRTAIRVCICYGGGKNEHREREREREQREGERHLPPNFARLHTLTGPHVAHPLFRRPPTRRSARLPGALSVLCRGFSRAFPGALSVLRGG